MSIEPNVTGFILAGGKSSRMGTEKAFVTLDGRTLLARALHTMRSVTAAVRIAGDPEKFAPFAPCVRDIFPECGPLGGIHAALRSSTSELNLILAVDLPFVAPALLHFLVSRARDSSSAAVVVPRSAQGWQPLCAVYRRAFAESAEDALRAGRFKIDALFEVASTQVVAENELEAAGFSPRAFRNVNTPEDLAAAQE
jgi:molybdopterin-guanine dinucleotide biosynthesis protein A